MDLLDGADGFMVTGVLQPRTCAAVVNLAEFVGFKDKSTGPVFAGDRLRATFTDQRLAECIWEALAPHCKPHTHESGSGNYSFVGPSSEVPSGIYVPIGVNPFMRVSKYRVGQSFREHTDTGYAKDMHYVGMHTVLVYLNEDLTGGETIVKGKSVVKPETGKALVFYHYTPHEGVKVTAGIKYVIRTEVMYKHQS